MKRAAALLLLAGCAGEKADGRPWVHDLKIDGVHKVSRHDLKKKLSIDETSFLHFPKRYLDPFALDTDRRRIEAYYAERGWFSARVIDAVIVARKGPKDHPSEVDVHFSVDEGEPTALDSIVVTGLERFPKIERELRRSLPLHARFVHSKYLEARDQIEARLKDLGYAWARVDGRVEVDRDARRASVLVAVDAGEVARFGHVHVRGTQRTSEHRVARHAGIVEGARFRPDALEDARGRIYNLGMFSSVRVDYARHESDPSIAEVIVTVQEGKFNEIKLGAGVGLESQRTDVHGSLVYSRRNWLGGLRTLRLRFEPAFVAIPAFWNMQRVGPGLISEATLTQPDTPWRRAELKYALGFDVGIEYPYQYYGPRTSLGVTHAAWRNHLLFGLSYNFQFLQFFNTDPGILTDPAQAGRLYGYTNPYRLGWWQQDVALDLRDQTLDAHKGLYAALSVEEGGVYAGGAFQYEKLLPDLRGYIPLGSRVTIALRAQFGQMFAHGDLGTPTTRRLYLGGPNSHRGFNYNRLSPQVPSGLPGIPPLPVGGDQMLLAQAELRVDLFRIAGSWLAAAAFFDAGDVGAQSVKLGDLHYATGGGLRYRTVIGTIRFDFGVRLNRLSPTEPDGTPNPDPGQRFAFHISVGEAF
jgi:translocation and assembly module TamA